MSGKIISPPLPLPIGFKLLPSLLPGRQLTPCLYAELNELPVYLIISPSLEPHLSLLSLVLALDHERLASPLSVILRYQPNPAFNPTLDGLAPWSDLWIPLSLAREVIRDIGADRLFWDDKGRGLLGDVDNAVSWEEDGGWSHNWLPAKSHLPASSYSFDNLLSTKWPSIEIIPDQRCVHTPADKKRLVKLISEGTFDNPSSLRDGVWDLVWGALLMWTKRSWTDYSANPSKMPTHKRITQDQDEPISTLIQSISALLSSTSTPAPPISSSDITLLFPSTTDISIYTLFIAMITTIWDLALYIIPGFTYLRRFTLIPESRQPEHRKLKARLDLALCALCWDVVIGIWRLQRENKRLKRIVDDGEDLPADIVIYAADQTPQGTPRGHSPRRKLRHTPKLDDLTKLERKRNGSPPPPRSKESSPSSSSSSDPLPAIKRRYHTSERSRSPVPPRLVSNGQSSRLSTRGARRASPESGSEEWFDIRQPNSFASSRPESEATRRSSRSTSNPSPGIQHPPLAAGEREDRDPYLSSADGNDKQQSRVMVKDGKPGWWSHSSDHWLERDSSDDEKGFMQKPQVIALTQTILTPIIFGMLVVIICTWWTWDPPEPSVVVL